MNREAASVEPARAEASGWKATVAAMLLITAAVAIVFGQAARFPFLIWDDPIHVTANPGLNPVTVEGFKGFWIGRYAGLYIPISYSFFSLQAWICGGRPDATIFHLASVQLHAANALLVFMILRSLFGRASAACAGALLFALHPVQAESVAWVSETRGLLCGFFTLLAVGAYLRFAQRRQVDRTPLNEAWPGYLLATLAFLLALGSKPTAVAAPLLAGVLAAAVVRRPIRDVAVGLGPWLVIGVIFSVATSAAQPFAAEQALPAWTRPLVAGDALAFYMYALFAPLQLCVDYGRTPAWVVSQSWVWFIWLVPVAFTAALACLPQRRIWLCGAALFVAALLPVLGFVPFDFQRISTVADRYLYLATLGPAAALAWFLSLRPRRTYFGATTGILAILAGLCYWQVGRQWSGHEAFFRHTLTSNRSSVVGLYNLGYVYYTQNNPWQAKPYFEAALNAHPHYAENHFGLGLTLDRLGDRPGAIAKLEEAIRLRPDWAEAHYHLGSFFAQDPKMREQGKDELRRSIELQPRYGEAYLTLASILADEGRVDEALDLCYEGVEAPIADPKHLDRCKELIEEYEGERTDP